MHPLQKIARERVLILDGAMGSMLQEYRLDEAGYRGARFADWGQPLKGNNDLLNLTQPEMIRSIHRSYLEAGADFVKLFPADNHGPKGVRAFRAPLPYLRIVPQPKA